jgi:hypothetical protein
MQVGRLLTLKASTDEIESQPSYIPLRWRYVMQFTLDGKSLAVGTFAGAALVAGLGAMQSQDSEVRPFQITSARSGNTSAEAFIVDTATGQAWSSSRSSREFYAKKLGAE